MHPCSGFDGTVAVYNLVELRAEQVDHYRPVLQIHLVFDKKRTERRKGKKKKKKKRKEEELNRRKKERKKERKKKKDIKKDQSS